MLVTLAVVWVGANLAGAWLAVDRKLPYDLGVIDAVGRRGDVSDDWLLGWGTGLAMPLAAIAAMGILAVLCTLPGAAGRVGTFAIALLGGSSVAFTLANRLSHDRLAATGTDRIESGLIITTLASAALLVLVGLGAWLSAARE